MDVPIRGRLDACVTQQLLQHLWLHTTLNCSCGIGVAQSMHAKPFDTGFVAKLVKMRVVGTVLCGFSGPEVHKHEITHTERCCFTRPAVCVLQGLRQCFGFFSGQAIVVGLFQYVISPVGQGDRPIALLGFGRPGFPYALLVTIFQRLVDCQSSFFQSMASHVKPIISPVRRPVSKIKAYCA